MKCINNFCFKIIFRLSKIQFIETGNWQNILKIMYKSNEMQTQFSVIICSENFQLIFSQIPFNYLFPNYY